MLSSKKPSVVFMLALWGESYISKFFNFSVQSLLAPGNIPAMSEEYDCTFLFLTTRKNVADFKAQVEFERLKSYCAIEFIDISDLIFGHNHSATLTLAFERGLREFGAKMCETYFFFLVSDYIMADGSLHNVKHYLKEGYSGITTGNFLVVEEYMSPLLNKIMQQNPKTTLSLNSKELLSLAFPYLHPISAAQIVTQSFTHAGHANRFFWKVSDQVMVGRFYLRHMLCIKPEIEHFTIGSFCDYSFIPEMCPSGNVAHIQDSDEYCMIEMAPFNHEKSWIQPGPLTLSKVASQLSEWTTKTHRANAYIPMVYHTEELKEPLLATIQKSEDFISQIEKQLCQIPQPIKGHPYWISCIESSLQLIMSKSDKSRFFSSTTFAGIIGSPTFSPIFSTASDDRFLLQIANPSASLALSKKQKKIAYRKKLLVGNSPNTSLWHLHWLDDYRMREDVRKKLAQFGKCVCIAFEPIASIIKWLESDFPKQCTYHYHELFLRLSTKELQHLFQDKQHVLFWLNDVPLCHLGAVLRQCSLYLPTSGTMTLYVKHKSPKAGRQFKEHLAILVGDLFNSKILCEKMEKHSSLPRIYLQRLHTKLHNKAFAPKRKIWTRFIGYFGLTALASISFLGNCLSLSSKKKCTSTILHFLKQK